MADDPFAFHRHLDAVARADAALVREKDLSYGSSWKKRGGVGAFMMLARKWDRLEEMVQKLGAYGGGDKDARPYDLFSWIAAQGRNDSDGRFQGSDGTVIAEIRDLRRYLLLVEAEMIERGAVRAPGRDPRIQQALEQTKPGTPEDGGHHALAEEEIQKDADRAETSHRPSYREPDGYCCD